MKDYRRAAQELKDCVRRENSKEYGQCRAGYCEPVSPHLPEQEYTNRKQHIDEQEIRTFKPGRIECPVEVLVTPAIAVTLEREAKKDQPGNQSLERHPDPQQRKKTLVP